MKFQIPVQRQVMLPVAFVVLVRRLTRVLPTVTGELVNSAWTVGAGVEFAFAPQWSAKIEYLYVDLGSVTCGAGMNTIDGCGCNGSRSS